MKVKIERIRKGVFLPNAKVVLAKMVFVRQAHCDVIVDDMAMHDIPVTLGLRGPFAGKDWDAFNDLFVFTQVPEGTAGTGKQFVDDIDDAEWDNEDFDDDEADEADEAPTEMLLFCIKTEARTGNKYEILVLATTEEIALEHAIRDPAVVKSITIVPGPFTNGTVLSTRLIAK